MMFGWEWAGPALAAAAGAGLIAAIMLSAIRTVVLPRAAPDVITRLVFRGVGALFAIPLHWADTYAAQDAVLALYAPISLLCLPLTWMAGLGLGYTGLFWAAGVRPWSSALVESGSSLLTLGFVPPTQSWLTIGLAFSEAALGLMVVALLISYLPTMYTAFSRRETAVTMLETRAGRPPSAVYLFELAYPLGRLDHLAEIWVQWEVWFAELDETHTSLPALAFFRSPQPHQSWVTAAGAVLDAAALHQSTLGLPPDPRAALCIRAGYLALRHICDFFDIAYPPDPHFPRDPISVTRAEFDAAVERLRAAGLPLKPDLDQAWSDFAGWRVNYDRTLVALCGLITAPTAPWSGDRPARLRRAAGRRLS